MLGGGEGGGGGGDGWMLLRSISAPRYWIELRLMYVVDVSEKLAEIVRVRVRVRELGLELGLGLGFRLELM